MSQNLPLVTIILPIRNESRYIKRCLNAVLAQDYPSDRLEILVVDGMSTDGTREIIRSLQAQHPNIRLIDNPEKIVSTGLNTALNFARGEIIIRVDGHCEVAHDFVRENVAILSEHPEAWSVGGPIVHTAETLMGKAIAVAMSHPLGVGNAFHRFPNYEGYGEGAVFPAIRRWVFERVGVFDEFLVRNQDDEFNYRIAQAGGKIYISPRIRHTYYVRERLRQLFRQYLQYGFWRIPVIKKHRRPTTLRQIMPSLFYFTLIFLLCIGVLLKQPIIALILPIMYSVTLLVVALSLLPRVGVKAAYRVPLAIATMHAGYAFGFMYGVWVSLFKPDAWDRQGKLAKISR